MWSCQADRPLTVIDIGTYASAMDPHLRQLRFAPLHCICAGIRCPLSCSRCPRHCASTLFLGPIRLYKLATECRAWLAVVASGLRTEANTPTATRGPTRSLRRIRSRARICRPLVPFGFLFEVQPIIRISIFPQKDGPVNFLANEQPKMHGNGTDTHLSRYPWRKIGNKLSVGKL